jgi:hypothetical protein
VRSHHPYHCTRILTEGTVNSGASQRLSNALSAADASYNGTSAVTAYAVQARNENAYRDIIATNIQGVMIGAATVFASQQARSLAGSSSLPTILRQAPQLLLQPVAHSIDNVRPFDVPVATAVDFVGLIYLMIIAFNAVLGGAGIRMATGIERRLTTRSLIMLRIVGPIIVYFFLSRTSSSLPLIVLVTKLQLPAQWRSHFSASSSRFRSIASSGRAGSSCSGCSLGLPCSRWGMRSRRS